MEVLSSAFPYWIAVRRRFSPFDPFFNPGNIERELLAKQVALDLTEDERCQIQKIEDAYRLVRCPIVGCGVRLSCLDEFEDHYSARHRSSCAICFRVYPTSRLLSMHVSEAHDSFFKAKVAHGFPMYECLVEGCGAKLKSYKSRKQHLMDKHNFPASFEFKRAKPSKHQRQKSHPKMEVDEVGKLVSAVSRLNTSDASPLNISFGHRHARAFTFIPRSLQQDARHHRSDDMR